MTWFCGTKSWVQVANKSRGINIFPSEGLEVFFLKTGRLSYIGCTESGTLAAELVSGSPITAAPDPATRELLYAAAGILSADA